ncbi:MAG TPA: FecR domain-containing protein [Bryobacteraceae bacterium]|nr:FecR domain-containing protein [Bryobacteraceae bacterium]
MFQLMKTPGRVIGMLFAAALFTAANAAVARPGTVNYTEGQVTLDGNAIQAHDLGSVEVAPDHTIHTAQGRAEILLTPGAYLRLGDQSAARMDSASLTDTRVELLHGEALVEVAQIEPENHLQVLANGVETQLDKKGLYDFKTSPPQLAVYDGKAMVEANDRSVKVDKGHEYPLTAEAEVKPQKFDRKQTDSLYDWSKLRSDYLAQANESSVNAIVVDRPGWYYGTGWYWNPWYSTWAFVPGGGYLMSPFGFGFYSPTYWVYHAPVYYHTRPGVVVTPRGWHGVRPGPRRVPALRGTAPVARPSMRGSFAGHGGHRR